MYAQNLDHSALATGQTMQRCGSLGESYNSLEPFLLDSV